MLRTASLNSEFTGSYKKSIYYLTTAVQNVNNNNALAQLQKERGVITESFDNNNIFDEKSSSLFSQDCDYHDFFFKLRTNIKLNIRQFLIILTQVFTCTCEINYGRGNRTQSNALPLSYSQVATFMIQTR